MPANTPKGYPYPLGTDPVADGDDAIKNLAQKVDTAIGVFATGSVNVQTAGTNPSNGSIAVVFPVGRFSVVPRIYLQQTNNFPAAATDFSSPFANNITAAGFTVNVRRNDVALVGVNWLATQGDA
jgi:hypothetical protein